jgi:hypothetical protein
MWKLKGQGGANEGLREAVMWTAKLVSTPSRSTPIQVRTQMVTLMVLLLYHTAGCRYIEQHLRLYGAERDVEC